MLGEQVERPSAPKEELLKKSVCLKIQIISIALQGCSGLQVSFRVQSTNSLLVRMHVFNHNVPCAVCFVPSRATTLMIPAKNVCPSSWTREYYGYLTAEASNHHRSSLNCVDIDPNVIRGDVNDTNGALFYYVSAECTALNCPPYEQNRILSCTVCTR